MTIKDDIKALIIKSGWSITEVVNEMNKRHNQDKTMQNLAAKLSRETLKYSEALEIADIIGYEIVWTKKATQP